MIKELGPQPPKGELLTGIKEYKKQFTETLTPIYGADEAESIFNISLEEITGLRRVDLIMNPDSVLTDVQKDRWESVLAQLQEQKPIQYIFGKAHFYGLEFKVTENTLIPRPETEQLVEWIIHENKNRQDITILDIGTGSGCIAISLADNLKQAFVSALDVSAEALAVAEENAMANNITVDFIQEDILTTASLPQRYDIIVSNPPYVRNLEKHEIKPNVLDFEPHLALFVNDNDPLIFYHKIAQLAKVYLKKNGTLYFEINQYLGSQTGQMLESEGFKNVILRKDMYGNDRMISCSV
ncbi:peptide chain release factor N(5)-glutamine methyltransferase [Flavobacterium sp. RHBU_24]|uniref:peptide chain release factor N(5)-glutamine methyltransferase n=1 Tax=Flavobacterium sp. RHBU_24 TaxID=3391185 RepID=UPI003984AEFE